MKHFKFIGGLHELMLVLQIKARAIKECNKPKFLTKEDIYCLAERHGIFRN
jgi:hypothetical protein